MTREVAGDPNYDPNHHDGAQSSDDDHCFEKKKVAYVSLGIVNSDPAVIYFHLSFNANVHFFK